MKIVKLRFYGDITYEFMDWCEENPPPDEPPPFYAIYRGEYPSEDSPDEELILKVAEVRDYCRTFDKHWSDSDGAWFDNLKDAENALDGILMKDKRVNPPMTSH